MPAPVLLTRLALALAIMAAGLLAYRLVNRWILARAAHANINLPGLSNSRRQTPILLYFTTPTCAPCKTTQRPAIQRLQAQLGEALQVIEINAAAQPEIASRWGVLSVPTTFILDPQGRPRHVNHGVTLQDKLLRQVNEASALERNF